MTNAKNIPLHSKMTSLLDERTYLLNDIGILKMVNIDKQLQFMLSKINYKVVIYNLILR